MAIEVNVDNYARAEVAAQVDRFLSFGTAVNGWTHIRVPTPLDQQSVIRMNRTRSTAWRSSTPPTALRSRCPRPETATSR